MVGRERREPPEGPPPAIEHDPDPPTHSIIPPVKRRVPLYSVTYQGIRIGSVAREPRRTHWVALSIIDNQAAKFATRKDASEWLKRRWIEERERAGSETR